MPDLEKAAQLFFKGLASMQGRDLPAAEQHFLDALAIAPGRASVLTNLSLVCVRTGRLGKALDYAEAAVRSDGSEPLGWLQKGASELKLEKHEDALQSLNTCISLNPSIAEAHNNRGSALSELKRYEEALASYRTAIGLKPNYAEAYNNSGAALKELKRVEDALASYDTAIRLKPDFAEAYSNRGNALKDLGRHVDAIASYDKAISLNPQYAEAYSNRGNVLQVLDRFDEALSSFDTAILIRPDYAEAHVNRGNVLKDMDCLDEALASYDKAIALDPDYAEAYSNRGNALQSMNLLDEAHLSYDKAIDLKPEYAGAHYNKSFLLLQRHAFREGFELQLCRWSSEQFNDKARSTTIPEWDGSALTGNLMLWAEQGIGDEVFYASMLSLLEVDAKAVTLSADNRLHPAFERAFPDFTLIDRTATAKVISGNYAAQAPVGNLGHVLKVDESKIASRKYPYLAASPQRKDRLAAANPFLRKPPVCGVAWKTSNKDSGHNRSIDLLDLAPVLQIPGVTYVNLQYGNVDEEVAKARKALDVDMRIASEVDVFKDIEGLLALLDLCDVVITIDNVNAHLAGAIGKKSVVLVPTGKGRYWYWGGEKQSVWYPSLNLIYQQKVGDWKTAINEAALSVRGLLGS